MHIQLQPNTHTDQVEGTVLFLNCSNTYAISLYRSRIIGGTSCSLMFMYHCEFSVLLVQ